MPFTTADTETFADLPTEVDSPEREPPFVSDEPPPARTRQELDVLVMEAMPLVEPVSRQVARQLGRLADADELASVGRVALFDAARAFNPIRGTFGPYARRKLRWAMLDSIRRETHGRSAFARARALHAAERVVDAASLGPPDPNLSESVHARKLGAILLAQATAMAVGLTAPFNGPPPDGLPPDDRPPSEPRPGNIRPKPSATVLADETNPEDVMLLRRSNQAIRSAVDVLPPRQREIVERHYYGDERFDHIAESLGISKSWASRLHAQAMEALAKALRDHR